MGLKAKVEKTKTMRINADIRHPVITHNQPVEDVNIFSYLVNFITNAGRTEENIDQRIFKARIAFRTMHMIRNELPLCST